MRVGFVTILAILMLVLILAIAIVVALCFVEGKILKSPSTRKRNYKIGVIVGILLCMLAFGYNAMYCEDIGESLMKGIDVKTAKADNLYIGSNEAYRKKILAINEVFNRYRKDGLAATSTKELEDEMRSKDFDSKQIQYDFTKKSSRNYDDPCASLLDYPKRFSYRLKGHTIFAYCKEHKELICTYHYRLEETNFIKDLEKAGLTGLGDWIKETRKNEGIKVKTEDGKTVELVDGTYQTRFGKEQILVSLDNDSIWIEVDPNYLNRYQVLSEIQSKLHEDGWSEINLSEKGYLKMISSNFTQNLKVGKEGSIDIYETAKLFVKDKKVSKVVLSFDQYYVKGKILNDDAFFKQNSKLGKYVNLSQKEFETLFRSLCEKQKDASGKIGDMNYQFKIGSPYSTAEINGIKVKESSCQLILYR